MSIPKNTRIKMRSQNRISKSAFISVLYFNSFSIAEMGLDSTFRSWKGGENPPDFAVCVGDFCRNF